MFMKRLSAALLAFALSTVAYGDGQWHLARAPRGGATVSGLTSTIPNVTALSSTFPSADPTGYDALTIGSQAAGFSWNDTVTGATTWKLTANGTPSTGVYVPWYAQMGLAISQAYGTNLDQYHIAFCNVATGGGGDGWLLDFGLSTSSTPGPRNYRALPTGLNSCASGGSFTFSRKAGNPDIMYVLVSGGKLRLYNVATAGFVDSSAASLGYSSSWPSTGWTWTTGVNEWLMVNGAETWASGNNAASGSGTAMFALNIGATGAASAVGTALTWTTGVDDTYINSGDFVYSDQNAANIWDLDNSTTGTNAFIAVSPTFGGNANFSGDATSHMAVMRGWWLANSTINSASVRMPVGTLQPITGTNNVIGTTSTTPSNPKYLGSYHTSGNWWLQPTGTGQFYLQSNFHQTSDPGSQPASEAYAASFVNVWNNTLFRLGFLYSDDEGTLLSGTTLASRVGSGSCPSNVVCYWSQPHATISHDGKLVLFGSNMRGVGQTNYTRLDAFVMEVPVTTGTPPSFP